MTTLRAAASAFLLSLAAAIALPSPAADAAETVRIAQQFGVAYLPLTVMKEKRLLERAAERRGGKAPTVEWLQFSGAPAMNDALISGNLDFASGGISPLITTWDKTRRSLGVRGVAALGDMPNELTTNRAEIRTLRDFTDRDKIALPAVKVSFQAVVLEMAAEQAFGPGNAGRLDGITVSMAHPDAAAALLSGGTEIAGHFTSPPFSNQELLDPKIHRVLSSYDVVGGPHTFNVVWATAKFHDANPETVAAFIEALDEADAAIRDDPANAARLYLAAEGSKMPAEQVERIIRAPDNSFTATPHATMKFATFLARTGAIKAAPADWKELFFPEIHGREGS
ncbi:MAG TPA: ABC transporter substrate-binding protein [Stellaceae bacterium]